MIDWARKNACHYKGNGGVKTPSIPLFPNTFNFLARSAGAIPETAFEDWLWSKNLAFNKDGVTIMDQWWETKIEMHYLLLQLKDHCTYLWLSFAMLALLEVIKKMDGKGFWLFKAVNATWYS